MRQIPVVQWGERMTNYITLIHVHLFNLNPQCEQHTSNSQTGKTSRSDVSSLRERERERHLCHRVPFDRCLAVCWCVKFTKRAILLLIKYFVLHLVIRPGPRDRRELTLTNGKWQVLNCIWPVEKRERRKMGDENTYLHTHWLSTRRKRQRERKMRVTLGG